MGKHGISISFGRQERLPRMTSLPESISVDHNKSLALFVVGFAFFTDYLILLAVIPILPAVGLRLGLSSTTIGVLFAAKPACQLLFNPLVGHCADIYGRKRVMLYGLFGSSAMTVFFAYSDSFAMLMTARCLQGVASATNAASMAFLADVFPDSIERGEKIGRAMTGISLGVMAGPLFGGFLYEAGNHDMRLPFLIAAGLVFFDGCLRCLVKEPESGSHFSGTVAECDIPAASLPSGSVEEVVVDAEKTVIDDSPDIHTNIELRSVKFQPVATEVVEEVPDLVSHVNTIRNAAGFELTFGILMAQQTIIILSATLMVGNATIGMMEVLLPLMLQRLLGLSVSLIGVVYGCGTLAYTLCAPLVPYVNKKLYGHRWAGSMIGLLCQGVPLPLLILVPHLSWVIPFWVVVSGPGMALIDCSVNPQLADEIDRIFGKGVKGYGRAFSIAQGFLSIGFIVGPIVGGALLEASGSGNFLLPMLVFCVMNILFVPVLVHGWRKTLDNEETDIPK